MATGPKKVSRPWVMERAPFERERTPDAFDYNGRKWRNVRKAFFNKPENALCKDCGKAGRVTAATVADHEPQAKVLIAKGLDPYDEQYLQPLCRKCHNAKSGSERHK